MTRENVNRLCFAAVCLALALLLPFLTGQIPQFGNMLLPMHLPVLVCGFLCGWPYGLAVGFAAPLLRSALFGMPPMMPTGLAMAFELAAYGAVAGLAYPLMKKLWRKPPVAPVVAALIVAMLAGRVVWGVTRYLLFLLVGGQQPFTFAAFLAGAFATAWPGIVLQLIAVPAIVLLLEKARLMPSAGVQVQPGGASEPSDGDEQAEA